jgi:predicted phosphohydrolase
MNGLGSVWNNHVEKIKANWHSQVSQDDIVLVCGDISWSKTLRQSLEHLRVLDDLPGKAKIIVKGNHDVWWDDYDLLRKEAPTSVIPLEGNAVEIDDAVFCGITGWLSPNDPCSDNLDKKMFERETRRLRQTLDDAMTLNAPNGLHLLMHFPPFTSTGEQTSFFDIISQYTVSTCSFGHFHIKEEWARTPQGEINGTLFTLSSTDFLNHKPTLIWER